MPEMIHGCRTTFHAYRDIYGTNEFTPQAEIHFCNRGTPWEKAFSQGFPEKVALSKYILL